jgi:hypothetical protein
MVLYSDAPSRTCGRAVGDMARAQRTQDDAGEVAAQETRALLTACKLVWSVFRLWLRREVLPSIATRPSLSGQQAATQDDKQGPEQVRIKPVHHRAQPVDAGNTVVELRKVPQKRQVRITQSTISS